MENRMASLLLIAARDGNVKFLIESLGTQPIEFFFTLSKNEKGEDLYNIIHLAILHEQAEFLKQTLDKLPFNAVHFLLCQSELATKYNAYHFAALRGNLTIVKMLVDFSRLSFSSSSMSSSSSSNFNSKPWLALEVNEKTPLHVALDMGKDRDECALEIMSLDMELLCSMVDNKGISPLLQAVRHGCEKVAVKILTSNHRYSTSGDDDLSPLDVAPNCSEEVCKLLLDKHPEMIKKVDRNGITLLHKWVMIGQLWPFELLLNRDTTSAWRKDYANLLCMTEKSTGNNPLHSAAYRCTAGTVQIAQVLVKAYIDATEKEKGLVLQLSPWKRVNNEGDTPLLTALIGRHEKLALYYMSLDIENLLIYATKSVLYAAVWNGCDEVAQTILATIYPSIFDLMLLKSNEGRSVLHVASNCTETTATLLVETLSWLINEPDDNGKTPLDVASELGTTWLIKLLLTKEPSSYKSSAWIEACKRGHVHAVEAFINYSPDFRTLCFDAQDSPLHHIKLGSYKQYQEFLAIPLIQEMINMQDFNNATPLHRALERQDILLAEVLLSTDGVSRTIQDNSRKTATNLLVELCDQDNAWEAMCQRIGINPRLRTNYIIQPNTIGVGAGRPRATTALAGEMRGTLSVVAALLATLTFAAGFTLPGGLNQDTGEALLAKKASFLVFILADTYAMCCAMLVLFCLMWSMVCDQDRALLLIDRSVLILIQSLYGTLLAFMTGVFTVISEKSLWASILVFFLCSLVALSANKTVLYKFLDKLAPSPIKDRGSHTRSLEEGTVLVSRSGDNS